MEKLGRLIEVERLGRLVEAGESRLGRESGGEDNEQAER